MRRYSPHIVISAVAILVALGHTVFPGVKIDAVTLTLLLIAVLPWLGFVFKSVEFPGGLKVEYHDLEKASEDAAKAGLLSGPQKKILESPSLALAEQDPNLALAGLRIEIEHRLREIAKRRGLQGEGVGIGRLLQLLRAHGAISQDEGTVLSSIIQLLIRRFRCRSGIRARHTGRSMWDHAFSRRSMSAFPRKAISRLL